MEERSLGEGDGNIRNRSIGSTFLRPSPSVPMPDEAAPRWDHRLILQAQLRWGGTKYGTHFMVKAAIHVQESNRYESYSS